MITDPALLAAISSQGGILDTPDGSNPFAVLAALTYCETDWGRLAKASRYERSYDRLGRYYFANRANIAVYGSAAASSWGPYQMMYPTAREFGFDGDPWELVQADLATRLAVAYLNKRVKAPTGPASYADAWNSGTNTDLLVPGDYLAKFADGYAEALAHYDR